MPEKLKLAMYWAASCGGCEISLLEIGEKILDVVGIADIVFCPCLVDTKYADVEAMPDGAIDVAMFNGGIRNTENAHIARLLRRKSKILVAFGSCANEGCIPAMGNLYDTKELVAGAFLESPSTDNPSGIIPQARTKVPEGEIEIPALLNTLITLRDVVDVDYFMPGCPPTEKQIWAVIGAIASGNLPPKGSHVGCGNKSVCDECKREKRGTRISAFKRPHSFQPEDGWCLLEQGLVCLGPATRSGCEARCIDANMPCRGCYGAPGRTFDQGAAILSAIGSMIDADNEKKAAEIVEGLADPAGTFYRFSMARSLLLRKLNDNPGA